MIPAHTSGYQSVQKPDICLYRDFQRHRILRVKVTIYGTRGCCGQDHITVAFRVRL
ncbi:hypothetical protein PITCH_A50026 [uncultured Desulfobacterium sp.]|uniref:Uncharacterized protein n=1 Tax=uncultured Desulfobacterium sp. TaxID=201089 RepID=A0A445N0G3_9BACT|nr:hypothetical protein PITCH_A50026 [uncultured Desulfobacterium sp.]